MSALFIPSYCHARFRGIKIFLGLVISGDLSAFAGGQIDRFAGFTETEREVLQPGASGSPKVTSSTKYDVAVCRDRGALDFILHEVRIVIVIIRQEPSADVNRIGGCIIQFNPVRLGSLGPSCEWANTSLMTILPGARTVLARLARRSAFGNAGSPADLFIPQKRILFERIPNRQREAEAVCQVIPAILVVELMDNRTVAVDQFDLFAGVIEKAGILTGNGAAGRWVSCIKCPRILNHHNITIAGRYA